jgi:Holliday junction resolvase RusA-like endonuclease
VRVEINLPIKAFSVNAYYYSNRNIKTKEAREYEALVLQLLEEYKALHDMALQFNEQGGEFSIEICIEYPQHIYFNKSGKISAKTFDVTNVEKPIVDLIMNRFMNIDDRFLVSCKSTKRAGAMHKINIVLELHAEA